MCWGAETICFCIVGAEEWTIYSDFVFLFFKLPQCYYINPITLLAIIKLSAATVT